MFLVVRLVVLVIILVGGLVEASDILGVVEESANRVGRKGSVSKKLELYPVSNINSFLGIYARGTEKSIRTLLSYIDFSNREYADAALTQLIKFLKTSENKFLYPFIGKEKLILLREEVGKAIVDQLKKNKNFNNYSLCTKALSCWGTKTAYDGLIDQILVVSGHNLYSVIESLSQFLKKDLIEWTQEDTVTKILKKAEKSDDGDLKKIVNQFLKKIEKKSVFECSGNILKNNAINISIFSIERKDGSHFKFVMGGIFIENVGHRRDGSSYPQVQWIAKDFFDTFYKKIETNRKGEILILKNIKEKKTCPPMVEGDRLLQDLRNVDMTVLEEGLLKQQLKGKDISHIVTTQLKLCLWCQHIKGDIFIRDIGKKVTKKKVYVFSDKIVMDDDSPHYTLYDKSNADTPSRGAYENEIQKIFEELSEKLAHKILGMLLSK